MKTRDTIVPVRRAVISVSDKQGIVEFAQFLIQQQVQIFSTGGTARLLSRHGIPNTDIAEYTGFPEMMDGRLKTLHPKIHGGLLGRQDADTAIMKQHGMEAFDLLVVNLYPFEKTIAQPLAGHDECVEQIDIGGPAMVRAAAKNHQRVSVVVDAHDYLEVQAVIEESGGIPFEMRARLAIKAFQRLAQYDAAIAKWLGERDMQDKSTAAENRGLPERIELSLQKIQTLRYGENPHQQAAFYSSSQLKQKEDFPGVRKIQGKHLSFNNMVDVVAAQNCCQSYGAIACAIVKHANPCGVACAPTPEEAYQRAVAADSMSAFGGVVAFSCAVDAQLAAAIVQGPFTEVLVAPEFSAEACRILTQKPVLRVMQGVFQQAALVYRNVAGGLLVQDCDRDRVTADSLQIKTADTLDEEQIQVLLFAWKTVRHVQSNAIVVAQGNKTGYQTIGIGGGQTSRIDAVRFATAKVRNFADNTLIKKNLVLASDAFFPFTDSIELAAQAGIRAIIQPGGSVKDQEIIAAAQEHSMAMVFTGVRHFKH